MNKTKHNEIIVLELFRNKSGMNKRFYFMLFLVLISLLGFCWSIIYWDDYSYEAVYLFDLKTKTVGGLAPYVWGWSISIGSIALVYCLFTIPKLISKKPILILYRDRLWLNIYGQRNKEILITDIQSVQLSTSSIVEIKLKGGKKIFLTPTKIQMDGRVLYERLLALVNSSKL